MPDKKISELDVLVQPINSDDTGILVRNGADYQFAFVKLLEYVSQNVVTGNNLNFAIRPPQDITGKNMDVTINTDNGKFYQKRNGTWTEVYSIPQNAGGLSGAAILYGTGNPSVGTGEPNDTYINTANGRFYQKQSNGWQQVFSMLNGPPGGPGPKGDPGTAGANGKSILSGPVNPSNQSTGTDGDFYINTNTYCLFGPKANSNWGEGKFIIPENFDEKADKTYVDDQDLILKNYINNSLSNVNGIKPENIGTGLLIDGNKKLTLDLLSKSLVSPTINVQWKLYKNDGTTPYNSSSGTLTTKNLIVDKGVKATLSATYKYPAPNEGQAAPTRAVSTTFSNDLPGPEQPSAQLFAENIISNRNDSISIQKPASGLIVLGGQVVVPTGYDAKTDSCSISFKGRGFYMYAEKALLSTEDVQALYNAGDYQDNRARTFNSVTPGVGKYFYYIYDAAFGPFTSVIYNDAEQYFGAFHLQPGGLTVINNAGINQNLIVVSSNSDNAFSNSKLAFS
jgi:hypothetical protein